MKKGPSDYNTTLFDEKKNKNRRFYSSKSPRYTYSEECLDSAKKGNNKHYNCQNYNVSTNYV